MKKVKMMLLSIALVAVVGGALAFKAKYTTTFCTAFPVNSTCPSTLACLNKITKKVIDLNGTTNLVCITTYDGNNCNTPGLKCLLDTPVSLTLD